MSERPYRELKEKNMALSLQDQKERPLVCRAMPVKITINNTHKCNLTCPLCFKQFEPGHNMSYEDLPIEIFRAVAEDVFPYADEVALSVSGEPLISKTIEEELELGARFGVHYAITTNGVPLAVPRLRDLVLRHVHIVHLSMDAGCKETFERIREGARWEQVMGALKSLLQKREKRGEGPKIYANFVMMRENIDELPQWVVLMAETGVDGCFAEHVVVPEAFGIQSLVHHKRLAVEKYAEARKTAERCGIFLKLPAPFALTPEEEEQPIMSREEAKEMLLGGGGEAGACKDAPERAESPEECPSQDKGHIPSPEKIRAWTGRLLPGKPVHCIYAWREIWVHHQGAVMCCDTNNFPHRMGTLPDEKVSAIWNGEKYQELRRRLLEGEVYAACRHCHVMSQIDNPEDPLSFVKGS
jgi:MoaA/NifB/PqqE/SkfB family radical SAM enzyme